MLIATYRPAPENKLERNDPGIRKALYERLGSWVHGEPSWCFYAGNEKEFWINSLLSVPVCPEQLLFADIDPAYIMAVYKPEWDAYLNAGGNAPLPRIKRASMIPEDQLFLYELLAEDVEYFAVFGVDMRMVKEAFNSGEYDDRWPGLSGMTEALCRAAEAQGRMMHRSYGDKTLEQYVSQSEAFAVRNVYLATLAVEHYTDQIGGGYAHWRQLPTDPDYVLNYYSDAYMAYDREPSEEELRYLHDALTDAVFRRI